MGIEIEFAALKPRDAATLVTQRFGGKVVEVDPHRYEIQEGRHGVFLVELDAQYAHPKWATCQFTILYFLEFWRP